MKREAKISLIKPSSALLRSDASLISTSKAYQSSFIPIKNIFSYFYTKNRHFHTSLLAFQISMLALISSLPPFDCSLRPFEDSPKAWAVSTVLVDFGFTVCMNSTKDWATSIPVLTSSTTLWASTTQCLELHSEYVTSSSEPFTNSLKLWAVTSRLIQTPVLLWAVQEPEKFSLSTQKMSLSNTLFDGPTCAIVKSKLALFLQYEAKSLSKPLMFLKKKTKSKSLVTKGFSGFSLTNSKVWNYKKPDFLAIQLNHLCYRIRDHPFMCHPTDSRVFDRLPQSRLFPKLFGIY